jgi:AraC-like DNA-binding protein
MQHEWIDQRPPRVVAPSSSWKRLVEAYFSFSGAAPALLLPTGGVDLMFIHSSHGGFSPPSVMIHGYVSEAFAPPRIELSGVGIRFRPGGFTALTGIPQHEVAGGLFDFSEMVSLHLLERMRRHAFRDGAADAPGTMERVVEEMAPKGQSCPSWLAGVNDVCWRRRATSVAGLAAEARISIRQLERLSRNYLGTGPKKFTRVQRLRRCLRRRISRGSWIEAALQSGYADQAHLSRECRSLLGVSPSEFLRLYHGGEVFRL